MQWSQSHCEPRQHQQHLAAAIVLYCTWLEVVQRDCQVRGLSTDDAMVSGRWRKMIRMVDEQEGCEWMDVSSGTIDPDKGQRASDSSLL